MAGEAIWRAAQITGDPALGKAVTNMLDYALKSGPAPPTAPSFIPASKSGRTVFTPRPPFSPPPAITTKPFSRSKATAGVCGILKKSCCRISGTRGDSGFRTGHFGEADKAGPRPAWRASSAPCPKTGTRTRQSSRVI